MEDKVFSRGYVKWTDEDGVFHKEPLYKHADLLAQASPTEQLAAEEVRRLNEAAEVYYNDLKEDSNKETLEALADLKKAPAEVLTVAQVYADEVNAPASAAEEPASDHDAALAELREQTA